MADALGYIRVSSDDQAESGLGLEDQRQRIAAYCQTKGLCLAEVSEDTGISGGKPLADNLKLHSVHLAYPEPSGLMATTPCSVSISILLSFHLAHRAHCLRNWHDWQAEWPLTQIGAGGTGFGSLTALVLGQHAARIELTHGCNAPQIQ
jgi:hypothetical protein